MPHNAGGIKMKNIEDMYTLLAWPVIVVHRKRTFGGCVEDGISYGRAPRPCTRARACASSGRFFVALGDCADARRLRDGCESSCESEQVHARFRASSGQPGAGVPALRLAPIIAQEDTLAASTADAARLVPIRPPPTAIQALQSGRRAGENDT